MLFLSNEKINTDIEKVKLQMQELQERYLSQKDSLTKEFKDKLAILKTREKDLKQKKKWAENMEKQKLTQNLSIEELQVLLKKHETENESILKNNYE